MKTLTTVLFAGGESRRMGVDKATLMLDGEPMWGRQFRIMRALGPAKMIVSARNKPVWCPLDIEVLLDEQPSRGPLSGLVAALEQLQTTHLLALAIDLPQMTSAHLKQLWSLSQPGIGIVPRNGKFFEPLSAIYPVEGVDAVRQALSANDVSLHSFIRTLAGRKLIHFYRIAKFEATFYRNVNKPNDLNLLC